MTTAITFGLIVLFLALLAALAVLLDWHARRNHIIDERLNDWCTR